MHESELRERRKLAGQKVVPSQLISAAGSVIGLDSRSDKRLKEWAKGALSDLNSIPREASVMLRGRLAMLTLWIDRIEASVKGWQRRTGKGRW